jgi:colanic acid/amylovoran biosynthesis glycosyltransferase
MTTIAYLLNHYPKVSHSFIRREIIELERQGITVHRLALRGWNDALVDPQDVNERQRTRYVLREGMLKLLMATLVCALARPRRFLQALRCAVSIGWRADRPLPYHLAYLAEACWLVQWLKQAGAGHVHAHFGTNPAEVALLAHLLGGPPYSMTVHGPEEFDKAGSLHLRAKLEGARFVVAISSYCRSQLYRHLPHGQWHKVQQVHCALEAAFHEVPATALPSAPRIVCVGRLCEQKGQLLLLDAVHRLAQRGIRCELVLAGDGEMRAELETLIAQHGISGQVTITGWISSAAVCQHILAARALVLPSFAEGLPVVLMEAMALGRPVLTTCIAGIPELVLHQETGWLFAAGDVEALALALEACLATTPEVLAGMGARGRQRVLARHAITPEIARLASSFRAAALEAGHDVA